MRESTAINPVVWPRRRWIWTILGLFILQIVLIAWWSDRQPVQRRPLPPSAAASLVLDESVNRKLTADFSAVDPLLFAQPQPHNFSGAAWLNPRKLPHPLQDWVDDSPLSGMDTAAIGLINGPALSENSPGFPVIAGKPETIWLEALVPYEPLSTGSVVRLEGDLSRVPLLSAPSLPVWPHNDVLSNSVVQLAVDGEGWVREARLYVECGLAPADRYAVRLAKQLRFQGDTQAAGNSNAARLTWGKLVVQWGTTRVSDTGQPPSAP